MTKAEAVEKAGLKEFDFALPQRWLDEIVKILDALNPDMIKEHIYGIIMSSTVWCYDNDKIFGAPHFLTKEAEEMYKLYERSLE